MGDGWCYQVRCSLLTSSSVRVLRGPQVAAGPSIASKTQNKSYFTVGMHLSILVVLRLGAQIVLNFEREVIKIGRSVVIVILPLCRVSFSLIIGTLKQYNNILINAQSRFF